MIHEYDVCMEDRKEGKKEWDEAVFCTIDITR